MMQMARPHIEFIQSQVLPWQRGLPGGRRDDVECKILSRDAQTGEASLLVRYPAGWTRAEPHHIDADEEIFVLDGALTINGAAYGKYSYVHMPGGYPRQSTASPRGAVAITFVSGDLGERDGEAAGGFDARRFVEKVDLHETGLRNDFDLKRTKWDGTQGMGLTNLRIDPDTQERTWVIGVIPMNGVLRAETHPVVEEMYLLEGEMAGNLGVMRAGAYFWRPPGVKHGPYGSKTGTLILFRSRGGPLSTTFHDDGVFSWAPEHRPVLPPELQGLGGRPWVGADSY